MSYVKRPLFCPWLWAAMFLLPSFAAANDGSRVAMEQTWNQHLQECEDLCRSTGEEDSVLDCMFAYGFTLAPMWSQMEKIPSQAVSKEKCEQRGYLQERWQACRLASFELINVQQQRVRTKAQDPDAFDPDLEQSLSLSFYSLVASCNWDALCQP